VLSNGLSIRIPNSQLITPAVEVDRNGSRTVDRSKRELLMGGVGDQPTTLGRYFFTAAYLMVDHDARTFTMWQANPTTKTNLVPVVRKTTNSADGDCGNDGSGNGGSGGNDGAGQGGTTTTPSSSVSTGTIAGAAVGGIAGLVVIAALVVFFLRRKRKQQKAQYMLSTYPPSPEEGSYQGVGAGHGYPQGAQPAQGYYKVDTPPIQEAPGNEHGPRELHGESTQSYYGGGGGAGRESTMTYELDGGGMSQERSPGYPQASGGGYGGYHQ
jgi:LPXTG-motif cell wall-anchored protein